MFEEDVAMKRSKRREVFVGIHYVLTTHSNSLELGICRTQALIVTRNLSLVICELNRRL